jgi:PAS domain-containing protein
MNFRAAHRLWAALRSWYPRFQVSREPTQEPVARLAFVADRVPVFIAQLDEQERYVFVNRPYAGHHGRRPEDIIGRHLREVAGSRHTPNSGLEYSAFSVMAETRYGRRRKGPSTSSSERPSPGATTATRTGCSLSGRTSPSAN